jgi:hypothetical protein
MAFGDLGDNGKADMATTSGSSDHVSVLLGNGQASFGTPINYVAGNEPYSLAIGDLNGDGKADLVTANSGSDNVSVLFGTGQGSFGVATNYGAGSYPNSVAIGDLNGDGKADLAVASRDSDDVSVLLGAGQGSFGPATSYRVGSNPYSVGIWDLNSDGKGDLAVTNGGSNNVSVLLNQLTSQPGKGSIHGRVFLGQGSVPMHGVDVTAVGSYLVSLTRTTNDGSFIFYNLPPGTYKVRASLPPYEEPATFPATNEETEDVANYPGWDPTSSGNITVVANNSTSIDIQFPWPVVMQGGLGGSANSTWDVLRNYLEKDPATDPGPQGKEGERIPAFLCFPMPNETEHPQVGYIAGGWVPEEHKTNAERLVDWLQGPVEAVLSEFVAPADLVDLQVYLIGHSMGGNIVQVYHTLGYAPPPARLVGLDSTFGGTKASIKGYTPLALCEAELNGVLKGPWKGGTPEYEREPWNKPYKDIDDFEAWLLYSCFDEGIAEWVFPDQSAWGRGRVMYLRESTGDYEPTGLVTTWISGWTYALFGIDHTEIHDDSAVVLQVARFLAYGKRPVAFANLMAGPTNTPQLPPPSPLSPAKRATPGVLAGSLSVPGGVSNQTPFDVDSKQPMRGQILRSGEAASYVLTNANGPVALKNLQTQVLGLDTYLDSFELVKPGPGTMTLGMTAGPSAPAQFDFGFLFENGRRMLTSVNPFVTSASQPVTLTGQIIDGLGNTLVPTGSGSVLATVHVPNQPPQVVRLYDDGSHGDGLAGDGVFAESFLGTTAEGRYGVEVWGSIPVGAHQVERWDVTGFDVQPTGATLTGSVTEATPDANGNGLFDYLSVSLDVSFTKNGSYRLVASVDDSTGSHLMTADTNFDNTQGVGTGSLSLIINGPEIAQRGVSGPFTFRDVTLFDLSAGPLPVAGAVDYTTQPYSAQSFEAPLGPKVFWISPASGSPSGGELAVLQGSGLADATSVKLGHNPASFTVVSENTLEVTIPSAFQSGGGSIPPVALPLIVDVEVVTPWGTVILEQGYAYSGFLSKK